MLRAGVVTFAEDAKGNADLARAEQRNAELRRDRDGKAEALRRTTKERDELAARLALVESIADLNPRPPKWLTPKRKPTAHHATLCTILSDMHLDEVVDPAQVDGVNAYDRTIATMRMRRYFEQLISVTRNQMAGVTVDGVLLALLGDSVSGNIHDELRESNEDTMPGTILYWSEMLAAGIDLLADEFGKVHVPVVPGNHGRATRKPRAKGRARDNWDWLLAHIVARQFQGDDRVSFDIPDSFVAHTTVYETVYRHEHGDQARGGSGWMGPLGPVMRREQKVRVVAEATDRRFDHLTVGHWHTLTWLPTATIAGSLKGTDEYALQGGFGHERPQMPAWLTTPEHGITMQAPILVADRKKEGW